MAAPKLPSKESVGIVLQFADSVPRNGLNGPSSRRLDAALVELSEYFKAIFQPAVPETPAKD